MVSSESSGGSGASPFSPPSSPPPSPADVQAMKELVLHLAKTAKAARIYARNNEIYTRFWAELINRMNQYLASRGGFALRIGPQTLALGNEVIYQPKDPDDNFAFKLYKDGLRQIDFLKGLPPEELQGFLDIIIADFDRANDDRDVVSLIWEHDFKFIRTLSVDNFAEEASSEDSEEELEEEDPALVADAEAEQLAEALEQLAELHLMRLDQEERREYREIRAGQASFDLRNALHEGLIFEIDSRTRAQVASEIETALEETPLAHIAEIFFELFRQETAADFPELLQITLGVLDPLLMAGDLEAVNTLLFPLRVLSMPGYARAFLHHDRVLELFLRLAEPARLGMLTWSVNQGQLTGGRGALFGYISLLPPQRVGEALAWAGQIEAEELRRAVIDALITVTEGELEPFLKAVRSVEPRLVADIIHGMGRVGDMQSLEVILGAYSHPDPKVREEALVALRVFESPRAKELMLTGLQDPAEAVRLAALRYVAVHRDKVAGRQLVESVESRAFKERGFAEKRAIMMAIAHIQGKEALPFLTGCLKQKRKLEVQRAAAHGIGVIGGAEARRLLETAIREAGNDLALECRLVLGTMK